MNNPKGEFRHGGRNAGPTLTAMTADSAKSTPSESPALTGGKSLVWSEEFDAPIAWGTKWVGDRTSAYRYGNHNPDDNKLDWLDPGCVTVSGGVATFTATPAGHTLDNGRQAWRTGLLTTEYSDEGFRVRTGDHVETRVRLPSRDGAWPALWTWKDGRNEVDTFEYHPDNPHLLELSNHVHSGGTYHTDADAIVPGGWVTVGSLYGKHSVDWYVNGVRVFRDGTGVGGSWSAYLILNLSLCAGRYHPAPTGQGPITFAASYVRVYR